MQWARSSKYFQSTLLQLILDRSLEPIVELSKGTTVRSVIIIGEINYGDFAAKNNVSVDRVNKLNGVDLAPDAVLADGSELYLPAK